MEKFQKWVVEMELLQRGRLTLIRVVLGGIPSFFLPIFRIPVSVSNILERLTRNFLWEEVEEGSGSHLLK